MIGTSSTPRSTSPTRAGKVSSLARSPVAPKITSASTLLAAIFNSSGRVQVSGRSVVAGRGRRGGDGCRRRPAGGGRRRARLRPRLELVLADAAPEHVIGPGLVDEH